MWTRGTVGSFNASHRAAVTRPDRRIFLPQAGQLLRAAQFSRRRPQLRRAVPNSQATSPVFPATFPIFRTAPPIFPTTAPNFRMASPIFPPLPPNFSASPPNCRRVPPNFPTTSPNFSTTTPVGNGLFSSDLCHFHSLISVNRCHPLTPSKLPLLTPLTYAYRVLGFRRPGNALRQSEPNLVVTKLPPRAGRSWLHTTFSNTNNK